MDRKAIFEQLKYDEGVRYEVYEDHLGLETFGVGHLVTHRDEEYGKPVGHEVSEERVWRAFELDLSNAAIDCNMLYGTSRFSFWPETVQEVLVNMVFNLGRTRLSKFVLFRQALIEEDWSRAAIEGRDSKWYRQVPVRAERLMRRLENIT